MKKEALKHPKLYDLMARLDVSKATALGYLTLMWDFTEDSATPGNIGKWPDGSIARACEWTGDPAVFVLALVGSGWLNRHSVHRLIVHDWPDHCQRWVRAKLLRCGQTFLDCYSNPTTEGTIEATVEATIDNQKQTTEATTEASPCARVPNLPYPTLPEPNQTKHTQGRKRPLVFTPPTLEEVAAYCLERNNQVDPEAWMAHYESNGWKVGRNPMKNWQAAVRTWEKNPLGKPGAAKATPQRCLTDEEITAYRPGVESDA